MSKYIGLTLALSREKIFLRKEDIFSFREDFIEKTRGKYKCICVNFYSHKNDPTSWVKVSESAEEILKVLNDE